MSSCKILHAECSGVYVLKLVGEIRLTSCCALDDAIEAMAYEDNKLLTLLAGKPDKTGEVEDWLLGL